MHSIVFSKFMHILVYVHHIHLHTCVLYTLTPTSTHTRYKYVYLFLCVVVGVTYILECIKVDVLEDFSISMRVCTHTTYTRRLVWREAARGRQNGNMWALSMYMYVWYIRVYGHYNITKNMYVCVDCSLPFLRPLTKGSSLSNTRMLHYIPLTLSDARIT
jgi:hypothetical protein